jgi:transcriptional regulator with XRE-family HTH domain
MAESLQVLFGRRVRSLRMAREWTQSDLAQKAKLDDKHVGAIERGDKPPSFDAVERLAGALAVECYELFLPEGRPTGDVEKEIDALLRDEGDIGADRVREFLRAMRLALRKLDGSRG